MQTVSQLKHILVAYEHRKAKHFRHEADQCTGERKARLLSFAIQSDDAAEITEDSQEDFA